MAKIKKCWRDLPLMVSFVIYVAVFLVLGLFLSGLTQSVLAQKMDDVQATYHDEGERYYLTNQAGERLGEGAIIYTASMVYSAEDERRLAIYETLYNSCVWIYATVGILLAAMLFYRQKLKRPFMLLSAASEKIMAQDLDFHIVYDSEDEMGKLCRSFEKMRQALWQNNQLTWRQMEERRRLNAAFAHDLRTPLTILKGYTDMLLLCDEMPPEMLHETAQTMADHVQRLERYTQTMSELQKLEDMLPDVRPWSMATMVTTLEHSAQMISAQNDRQLRFSAQCHSETVLVDDKFLLQVWENLLSNAVRHAQHEVTAMLEEDEKFVHLLVGDDGAGFSAKALQQAAEPYYTEDSGMGAHLGLGLYVSSLLCHRHGGYLRLSNGEQGAQVEAVFAKESTP